MKFAHIAIRVKEIEKIVDYYVNGWGFKEAFRINNDDGTLRLVYINISDDQYLEICTDGENRPEFDDKKDLGFRHICFYCDDIVKTRKEMEDRGVVFDSEISKSRDNNLFSFLFDPEGNKLELVQIFEDSPQYKFINTNNFLFSPIKDQEELMKAIEYVHLACHKLCKRTFGKYLPVSGNLGIFCHFDDEFEYLTKMREELTITEENINNKYFRLHKPIVIPAMNGIPETTYYYLYIRRPEEDHPDAGDVDFYLEPEKYFELKNSLLKGERVFEGVKVFERVDIDYIKLFDPKVQAAAFVGTHDYTLNK